MGAISDAIVNALQELLRVLFGPITEFIETYASDLLDVVVSTPRPNSVLSQPTNDAWPAIYEYYWEGIIPISLLLWALSVGIVIFLESSGHLFSGYHQTRLKKRVFAGLLGILSWWWIAALSLRFSAALSGVLLPDLSDISLFQTLSFAGIGVLGLVLSLSVDLVLFGLIALLYFARQLALYVFVLGMPILIALWVPGIGPFAGLSRFMSRLAGFYIPLLFMTLPVVLLFRLGGLLGESFSLSVGGLGAWLTGLIIPLIAVIAPIFLVWQASDLFGQTQRLAGYSSGERRTERIERGQRAQTDFRAGLHGHPPPETESGNPTRAYALGSGVSTATSSARERIQSQSRRSQTTTEPRQPDIQFPALREPTTPDPGSHDPLEARNHVQDSDD